jgi:sensor histidine kinase YesM
MQKSKTRQLYRTQWIIWVVLFALNIVPTVTVTPIWQSSLFSAVGIASYIITFYGNTEILMPRLYDKNRKTTYILVVIVLLVGVATARTIAMSAMSRMIYPERNVMIRWMGIWSLLASIILVYIASVLFYISRNYFQLKQKQEQLQKRQIETQLNLLKAQVQPHFLFNTLNNIYFVAQRESPATAALLERLSLIMRYFIDEAPKDRILLQTELDFIKSYISLEKMRMRYPLEVKIEEEQLTGPLTVPPMLLIPLVENVFKHGIDKLRKDNFIHMTLSMQQNRLIMTVKNHAVDSPEKANKSQTGLRNLRERLELLFGDNYTLQAKRTLPAAREVEIFHAQLNIPL